VPELVLAEVDAALGRNDPDAEIRHLLRMSVGLNLALDYLPGSTMFDSAAGDTADPETASMAVWFDAFVQNVDRTARNPNLLVWHRVPYFIDHGAALYFHHQWESAEAKAESPFTETQNHVLLRWATGIEAASAAARERLTPEVLRSILELVPDEWLASESVPAKDRRDAYFAYLTRRLAASANFEEEAIRAQRLV
jgi:hypothetical protein